MTDKEQKEIFAKNLQRYLYESGKTQKEVADIIRVNAPTFNSWVKGVSIPRMGKVQRLADYFGISVTDLIDEHTPEEIAADAEQSLAGPAPRSTQAPCISSPASAAVGYADARWQERRATVSMWTVRRMLRPTMNVPLIPVPSGIIAPFPLTAIR